MKKLYIFLYAISISTILNAQLRNQDFNPDNPNAINQNLQHLGMQVNDLKTQDTYYRYRAYSYYASGDGINYMPVDSAYYTFISENYYDINYYYEWDGFIWIHTYSIDYTYDANMNIVEYNYKSFDGLDYTPISRGLFTFNSDGLKLSSTYQNWDGTDWVNIDRVLYSYNPENQVLSYTYQTWDGSVFTDNLRYLYTYDANGLLLTNTSQISSLGVWENNYLVTNEYTASGSLSLYLYQVWDGSSWENDNQYVYEYDASGNKILSLYQNWSAGVWLDYSQELYNYDELSGLLSYYVIQYSILGVWEDYYRYIYDYTEDDFESAITFQTYTTDWENLSRTLFVYDEFGNRTKYEYQDFDGSIWLKNFVNNSYFDSYTSIQSLAEKNITVSAFPNPYQSVFTIQLPDLHYAQANIQIHAMDGKVVYSQKLKNSNGLIEIKADDLPTGNYFLTVATEKGLYSAKIEKQ